MYIAFLKILAPSHFLRLSAHKKQQCLIDKGTVPLLLDGIWKKQECLIDKATVPQLLDGIWKIQQCLIDKGTVPLSLDDTWKNSSVWVIKGQCHYYNIIRCHMNTFEKTYIVIMVLWKSYFNFLWSSSAILVNIVWRRDVDPH